MREELAVGPLELRKRVSASDKQESELQTKLDACQKRVAAQHEFEVDRNHCNR